MSTLTAVDLFSGLGGFTEGARAAGVEVRWAANHWRLAVETHQANHRGTVHSCQDLEQADFTRVPAHDVLLASPACQGHTHARGKDRPHHDALRSTAWAVIACVEVHQPRFVVVENVPGFRTWKLYGIWRQALEAYGYELTEQVLDAADFGVPQNRERLFVVGSREGALELEAPDLVHRPIGAVLDFSEGTWSPIAGHCRATVERAEAGRLEHGERFVAPYNGSGSGLTGRSLDRPIGTVTTVDRWMVVDGDRMRMLTVREYRQAMGFRADYRIPTSRKQAIKLLGNAVCPPVAQHVLEQVAVAS